MDPLRDEVEDSAAFHLDGLSRVMSEHERGSVVRRVLPHHPRQDSSGHGPRTGPNMFRPMIHAPKLANPWAAKSSSMLVLPPSARW